MLVPEGVNTTRKRAHLVPCKGIEKLKRTEAPCKIEGVIVDLRETAWPKKHLAPRNEIWKQ